MEKVAGLINHLFTQIVHYHQVLFNTRTREKSYLETFLFPTFANFLYIDTDSVALQTIISPNSDVTRGSNFQVTCYLPPIPLSHSFSLQRQERTGMLSEIGE